MSTVIIEMERERGKANFSDMKNSLKKIDEIPSLPHKLTEEKELLELNHKRSLMLGNLTISHHIEQSKKWRDRL